MASKSDPGRPSKRSGSAAKKAASSGPPQASAAEEGAKPAEQQAQTRASVPIAPTGSLPPIIFHINPAISSLSPPGAVVGTSDLTLDVFGSNFGSGSVVQWNQRPLKTTPISATQLQAVIPAANMAAAVQATVTVSNPGTPPSVSNGVTFNVIPDITAIISQLQQVTANPAALLAQLQTYITIQQQQIDSLTSQVNSDQTTISGLNSQIGNLQTTITSQQNQINTLTGEVNAAQAQSASPLDVAQSFKSVVDSIQQSAQSAGGIQTTVTNMNVQIKSLLNVQAATSTAPAKATLIFPSPTALPDPNHLSTMSLSFGAIPNLQRPAPTAPAPSPAPPAPPPAPGPAPSPSPAPKVKAASSPAPPTASSAEAKQPKKPGLAK